VYGNHAVLLAACGVLSFSGYAANVTDGSMPRERRSSGRDGSCRMNAGAGERGSAELPLS
jgi:hypothetical protein